MLMIVVFALAYLALIPGMYCLACAIDVVLNVRRTHLDTEWGVAVFWPMVVVFCVIMFAVVCMVAPFAAASHGRKFLRDAVLGDNDSDGTATESRLPL